MSRGLGDVYKRQMLATAQAATTIIYQGAYQMGLPDTALEQIATDADNLYMDYVLSRTELYIREDLQLTGAYTPYQYYIVSGLLLLLFFSGIVFLSFIKFYEFPCLISRIGILTNNAGTVPLFDSDSVCVI